MGGAPAGHGESFEIIEGPADFPLRSRLRSRIERDPAEYGNLGLDPLNLKRHIAYDIGAAALTRALAKELAAPAVLSRFSRLLIDPNRGDDDPTLVMKLSDGAIVPGNAKVDDAEVAETHRAFLWALSRGDRRRDRPLNRGWRHTDSVFDPFLHAGFP